MELAIGGPVGLPVPNLEAAAREAGDPVFDVSVIKPLTEDLTLFLSVKPFRVSRVEPVGTVELILFLPLA